MPPREKGAGPCYTTPALFLEMERAFKAEKKANGANRRSNKGKNPPRRATAPLDGLEEGETDEDQDEVDQLESELEDAAAMDEPRKKRARAPRRGAKTEKGRGKKDRLTGLPKEVFLEIAAYLNPGGLLSLARTSKKLRKRLVADTADSLWADARARCGLPDLTEGETSEEAYAALVFGKACQTCGKCASRMPDTFLRIRLCKSCKSRQLVKLDNLNKTHPELHPLSGEAVLRTSQTPTQPSHLATSAHWGLLPSLERESDALWLRQEKDDKDEEARLAHAFAAKRNHGHGSKTRPLEHGAKDDDGEMDEGDSGYGASEYDFGEAKVREVKPGKRVRNYLEKRREVLEPLEKEGKTLFDAVVKLFANETPAPAKAKEKTNDEYPPSERRTELEGRLLSVDGDYKKADFDGPWWTKNKLVNEGADEIDDEEWDRLKRKLVKLLDVARKKRTAADLIAAEHARQDAVRPYYDALRNSSTFFPLFNDFLAFPSVEPFWTATDAVLSDASWSAALPNIAFEVGDWRASAGLAACRLILLRTLEIPADEELASDILDFEDYLDDTAFWESLSSCLCCEVRGCYKPKTRESEERSTFFGSLLDVLEHQHEAHQGDLDRPVSSAVAAKQEKKRGPKTRKGQPAAAASMDQLSLAVSDLAAFHLSLPLEVAVAADALAELVTEDPDEETTVEKVDELFEDDESLRCRWWIGDKAQGRAEREWRKVICKIKREADKAIKASPPRIFAPTIGLVHVADQANGRKMGKKKEGEEEEE
ncbi:hypothetical protein JCM8097_003228 [Rhodosporidiobolus ruineniae]